MATYIARRLLHMLAVLIIITLLVFFVMRLMPGDPLIIYIARSGNLENMSFSQIEDLRIQYGLDKPLMVQYFNWVGGVLHGDFGESIIYKQSVGGLLADRFPVTLNLGIPALIISSILGIAAGIVAAIWRGKWPDKVVTPLSYIGLTIPVFWLGILMIYTFGLKLHWLPIAGYTSPFTDFWMSMKQLVMPVTCISIFGIAANARQMRSSMLEVVRQDYIRTAWSKGLPGRLVILKHALKNSIIPVVTLIGFGVGIILGGDVLVETVFAIPGIGYLTTMSILASDYIVVQSITLLISIVILFSNLLVDLSYAWLDPRIRYG
jgi:peptide/nickel transport system permease protein